MPKLPESVNLLPDIGKKICNKSYLQSIYTKYKA